MGDSSLSVLSSLFGLTGGYIIGRYKRASRIRCTCGHLRNFHKDDGTGKCAVKTHYRDCQCLHFSALSML